MVFGDPDLESMRALWVLKDYQESSKRVLQEAIVPVDKYVQTYLGTGTPSYTFARTPRLPYSTPSMTRDPRRRGESPFPPYLAQERSAASRL